jgi:hypothetical protein
MQWYKEGVIVTWSISQLYRYRLVNGGREYFGTDNYSKAIEYDHATIIGGMWCYLYPDTE